MLKKADMLSTLRHLLKGEWKLIPELQVQKPIYVRQLILYHHREECRISG